SVTSGAAVAGAVDDLTDYRWQRGAKRDHHPGGKGRNRGHRERPGESQDFGEAHQSPVSQRYIAIQRQIGATGQEVHRASHGGNPHQRTRRERSTPLQSGGGTCFGEIRALGRPSRRTGASTCFETFLRAASQALASMIGHIYRMHVLRMLL
ncbi:unnamed protein product, partial [Laminaria digitata]